MIVVAQFIANQRQINGMNAFWHSRMVFGASDIQQMRINLQIHNNTLSIGNSISIINIEEIPRILRNLQ